MVEGYCVKCKQKGQKMKDVKIEKTSRGGFIAKGKCHACGNKMCAMMSEANAEKAIKSGEAKKAF
jgi:hypothetical protein